MAVGKPDEGEVDLTAVGDVVGEQGAVQTIGFAQLPLHAVAVDGMLEVALRYADQNPGFLRRQSVSRCL